MRKLRITVYGLDETGKEWDRSLVTKFPRRAVVKNLERKVAKFLKKPAIKFPGRNRVVKFSGNSATKFPRKPVAKYPTKKGTLWKLRVDAYAYGLGEDRKGWDKSLVTKFPGRAVIKYPEKKFARFPRNPATRFPRKRSARFEKAAAKKKMKSAAGTRPPASTKMVVKKSVKKAAKKSSGMIQEEKEMKLMIKSIKRVEAKAKLEEEKGYISDFTVARVGKLPHGISSAMNELVCDLVKAIHYETPEETYQINKTTKDDYQDCNNIPRQTRARFVRLTCTGIAKRSPTSSPSQLRSRTPALNLRRSEN